MTAPAKPRKKAPARKATAVRKSPTTAKGDRGSSSTPPVNPAGFLTAEDPNIRYTLTAICNTAQDIEDGIVKATDRSSDAWHKICPIATLHGGKVTICNHEWHLTNPTCWICKARHMNGTSTQLDPQRRCCIDAEACALRAKTNLESDPRFERYQQYREAARAERAENGLGVEGKAPKREPRVARPTEGTCDHCGAATKGGHFVAGHDAKLKGELKRLALGGDHEALAEMMLRPAGWLKNPAEFDPGVVRQADEIVQKVETVAYLTERSTARAGRHLEPGT